MTQGATCHERWPYVRCIASIPRTPYEVQPYYKYSHGSSLWRLELAHLALT